MLFCKELLVNYSMLACGQNAYLCITFQPVCICDCAENELLIQMDADILSFTVLPYSHSNRQSTVAKC